MEEDIRIYLLNLLKVTPNRIKKNIISDNKALKKRSLFYDMKGYIDNFLENKGDSRLFIIPGLRAVGKTTLIYQIYYYLYTDCGISENQILYLDLESVIHKLDFDLMTYLMIFIEKINEDFYLGDEPLFIFIDEAHCSSDWGHVAKVIFDSFPNVFTIFTGSNALNLESNYEPARRALRKKLYPLNFAEYLNLKYGTSIPVNLAAEFYKLIKTGDISDLYEIEDNIQVNEYSKVKKNIFTEWDYFLEFGSFPFSFNKEIEDIVQLTLDSETRIIERDIDSYGDFSKISHIVAYQILEMIAMSKPEELSLNKIANTVNSSHGTVKVLIDTLIKTQLLFSIDVYGSIMKRNRKASEYYFSTPQFKSSIARNNGQVVGNLNEYKGILTENLVASELFKLKDRLRTTFQIFYDPRKGGVDFLVKGLMDKVVPIEVGYGEKSVKQVKRAISAYKSNYGIIISNNYSQIRKEDDIIFIPLMTFSLL